LVLESVLVILSVEVARRRMVPHLAHDFSAVLPERAGHVRAG